MNGEDLSPFYLMSPRILFQGYVWGGCKGLSWGEEFGLIGLPFTPNTMETHKVTHKNNMHTNHHNAILKTFNCIVYMRVRVWNTKDETSNTHLDNEPPN